MRRILFLACAILLSVVYGSNVLAVDDSEIQELKSHTRKLQLNYSFIRDEDTFGDEIDRNIFRAQL